MKSEKFYLSSYKNSRFQDFPLVKSKKKVFPLMLAMENSSRYNRAPQLLSSLKQRENGYEPSDTESEWQESPWQDLNNDNHQRPRAVVSDRPKTPGPMRYISPLSRSQRYSSNHDYNLSSPVKVSKTSSIPRRNSRSPYKPHKDDNSGVPPKLGSDLQRSISPFLGSGSGHQRHISPYKLRREEQDFENDEDFKGSNWKQSQKFFDAMNIAEDSRQSERSHYSHRSLSAPKLRTKEKDHQISYGTTEQSGSRSPSPLTRNPSRNQRESFYPKSPPTNEVHEMVANAKIVNAPLSNFKIEDSIESILPGDIFFSHDYTPVPKTIATKNSDFEKGFAPKLMAISERNSSLQHQNSDISGFDQNPQVVSVSTLLSQTNTNSSSVSRQSSKVSNGSSKMSDSSGKSFTKFASNREKNQKVQWFSCVRGGSCRKSKSPENRAIDETSFIEKAFVVENLRQFWADKHRPGSLSGFICHKQQAQHLKQLISLNNCPHILFKGPSGAGKKALIMALLREIYGDSSWKINHERRYFHVQETRPMQILVPLISSPHHVELNLKSESKNARYALMAIVKELTSHHMPTPEVSDASFKADFKVIILHEVDKLAENVQHLIKWIMDCYSDACKIILCCEDDTELLESIKSRCKLIEVDAPVTHEIMEVLIQIARKENFDLSMGFAAKIATKSKQNLRKAIMALEACKAHNYPFVDEQPIPLGWEEVLVELASEILADPSPKRLFYARGKFQKLLVDFVHPKLILQKLVEQFLKGVEASLKRELYYWHAYYDKRLPTGTSALLKLEEFVAKFMSIYRKSFGRRPFP